MNTVYACRRTRSQYEWTLKASKNNLYTIAWGALIRIIFELPHAL